jgi:SAM-dependent methyltransferase
MRVSALQNVTALQNWLEALEKRHFAELSFAEVSRALRALSSTYVERRNRLAEGAALSGAGKRAAFALFYGPLHFLLIEKIAAELCRLQNPPPLLLDLGCGTGAAGAAWANVARAFQASDWPIRVLGIDRNAWALEEAAETYRHFGLSARIRRGDIATVSLPKEPSVVLAAFAMNELPDRPRDTLMTRLVESTTRGNQLLIVEPLAGRIAPWWEKARRAFESAGGRADEWRFRVELPPLVSKLDRASGLDHTELTGRTLWLGR